MKIFLIIVLLFIVAALLAGCRVGVTLTAVSTAALSQRSFDVPTSTTVKSSRQTTTPTLVAAPQTPLHPPSKTATATQAILAETSPTITVSEIYSSVTVAASATKTPAAQNKPTSTAPPFGSETFPYRFYLGWSWKPAERDLLPQFVAANDGSIYVTDTAGVLYRLSPNGDVIWSQQISFAGATPAALSPDGLQIYVIGNPNTLFALNTDAEILWELTLQHAASEAPRVAPWGDIYVRWIGSGGDGYTRVSSSGSELPFHLGARPAQPKSIEEWIFSSQDKILIVESSLLKFYQPEGDLAGSCAVPQALLAGGPTLDESGGFYTVSFQGELIAWDSECKERWRFTSEMQDIAKSSGAAAYPIVIRQDGVIIFAGTGNWMYALRSDGKLIWQTKADDGVRFLITGKRGDVFASTLTGLFRAYDKKGEQILLEEAPILDVSAPLVKTADGGVAFVRLGELWVISLLVTDS